LTSASDKHSIFRSKQTRKKETVMNIFSNKNLLIFLGGVALGILGSKAVKNEKFRQLCMLGLAKGIQMKDQLGVVLEGLQENAADFLAEASALAGTAEKTEAPAEEKPVAKPRARRAAGTRKPRAKKTATK